MRLPGFRSLDVDIRTRKDMLEVMRATYEVGNVLNVWHLRKTWFQSNFGVCGLLPAHYSKSGIQILFFITLVFSLPFLMLFYLFSALCGSQVLTRSPEPVLLALAPLLPM